MEINPLIYLDILILKINYCFLSISNLNFLKFFIFWRKSKICSGLPELGLNGILFLTTCYYLMGGYRDNGRGGCICTWPSRKISYAINIRKYANF